MAISMRFRNFGPPPKPRKRPKAAAPTPTPTPAAALPVPAPPPPAPAVPAFGNGQRFRALNIEWRERDGTVHTETVMTGFEIPKDHRAGFWESLDSINDTLAYHTKTGQRFAKFFVNDKDGARVGAGFFEPNVTTADISYLLAKLAMSGFAGQVAWTATEDALDLDGYTIAELEAASASEFEAVTASQVLEQLPPGVLADLIDGAACLDGDKLAFLKTAIDGLKPMPKFGDAPLCIEVQHGDAREYLRFEAGEQLPQRFAAMWHARRDDYAAVLSVCKPRNFIVYDVRDKRSEPTDVFEMRGEYPYTFAKIGGASSDDDDGGGFAWKCHGSFDDETPSAEVLAFIECRLAATGRWPVLIPHQFDFVPDAIFNLMNGGLSHDPDVNDSNA